MKRICVRLQFVYRGDLCCHKGKGNLFAVIYELPFESISPVSIFPVRATPDLSEKTAVRRTWSLLGVQMGSFVCQTLVDPFSRPHPALQQRGPGRKSREKKDTSLSFRNQIVWWHWQKGCEQEECILFSGSQITSPLSSEEERSARNCQSLECLTH